SPGAGSPSAVLSPSPSASARPSGLLFAVLEARQAGGTWRENDTVAIAGLDGFARAKAKFQPRTVPKLCDAELIPAPEAVVANGRVYFADGTGRIRSLDAGGGVSEVGSVPVGRQQVLSFSVEASGRLWAERLTVPTYANGGSIPCQQ